MFISNNPNFHKLIKHVEVAFHFVQDNIINKPIFPPLNLVLVHLEDILLQDEGEFEHVFEGIGATMAWLVKLT